MNWYKPYESRLLTIYDEVKLQISTFPAPLGEAGLRYAEKFNPIDENGGKDYICTLLPFWMQDFTGISDELCNRLVTANIYGMLYFFIQDDVMDNTEQGDWKSQLALANLLQLGMFRQLRSLFPSDHLFWKHYEQYVSEWAACVMNEKSANYFIHDPLRTAGKAGPVKISAAGALMLANMEDRIEAVEKAIDITLMTLQMLDDWADWREDLVEGSYNGLIAFIASEASVEGESLTPSYINDQIILSDCISRYAAIANRNHELLTEHYNCSVPLTDFHAYMTENLNEIAQRIKRNKLKALGGGINFFK